MVVSTARKSKGKGTQAYYASQVIYMSKMAPRTLSISKEFDNGRSRFLTRLPEQFHSHHQTISYKKVQSLKIPRISFEISDASTSSDLKSEIVMTMSVETTTVLFQ
jgi:hypothetical protein